MKNSPARSSLLTGVSAAALLAVTSGAALAQTPPRYAAGDFHNHTTCTDGAVSTTTMIRQSVDTFGLEWLVDAGHGGTTVRDCSLNDPQGDSTVSFQSYAYADRLPESAFKGDVVTGNVVRSVNPTTTQRVRAMWRWQNLDEFNYPLTIAERQRSGKNVFLGMEPIVPGHEHSVAAIVNGQVPRGNRGIGVGTAIAQFEYLFDRADGDMGGGPAGGVANAAAKITNVGLVGNAAHAKSVRGVEFLQANYPLTSYELPAHLERAGPFLPAGNGGYNIEHLRDWNNAGPTVSFGFESQPGHQADQDRGSYSARSNGLGTYGGTGIYAAKIGGVWDGLLGEGRNWFFFASSDWHNRGSFSPFVRESDADYYPGENQKQYILADAARTPQGVIDGLRSGNAYSVMADLIGNDMQFEACITGNCAATTVGMGRTLVVPAGASVTVTLGFTQPTAPNFSPYSFPNPLLAPLGISQPLNRPIVDHVDFIRGNVTGVIPPGAPNYAPQVVKVSAAAAVPARPGIPGTVNAPAMPPTAAIPAIEGRDDYTTTLFNPSAQVVGTFSRANWTANGARRTMTFTIPSVTAPTYVRARGTNLPPGTPNVTDAAGNPLLDYNAVNVVCSDSACPPHLPTAADGTKRVDLDVRAWATPWFYANPIFMRPAGSPELLIETNANLARNLAGLPPL